MKTQKPEQVMQLSDTRGMLRVLATAEIRQHGRYLCMVGGKRTEVVPDGSLAERDR